MMKIAVACESLLLQKSLELFLEEYLSSMKSCDIIVSDQKLDTDKKRVYISSESDADLKKPFSKSKLISALEKVMQDGQESKNCLSTVEEIEVPKASNMHALEFKVLQEHIEKLTQEYQENLIKTIRAFYEK